ncbi:hypothetical protein BN1184_AA_01700 [Pantoea ananatis]|nr:hypothetical protein BN1182_AA_01690 [Pantoea ananatis]CRH31950.1 hypothetical protein BN1183_AA_01690 [Pantoea ananatis]CRH35278.1 hypothetical protein BN1184_AA_01700 [Pantoea ananatis]
MPPPSRIPAKSGVANGTRTHDNWNHNPGLYQLSYSHHCTECCKSNPQHLNLCY